MADDESTGFAPFWHVKDSIGKAFVDLQNDVTTSDVKLAAREGFRIAEHLKRYTTLGMATDQGKTGNATGMAVLAEATERPIAEVGMTTFRPPFSPVAIGAFAGHHRGKDFRPTRLTPSHRWARGARRESSSRPATGCGRSGIPEPGETDWLESVTREVKATRERVGVCDVSTLGKIDVQGPDAGVFLDRVYANTFSTLPVGKARYGLMLREDGFALDDGTTARLAEDHYFMTTTTANAVKVMQHLEFCHQCIWPELDVQMVSVDRAMGAIRHRRAEGAGGGGGAGRPGRRRVERGLPLPRRRPGVGLRRRRGGSTASPSRASSPTRSACRRASATR